MFEQSRLKSDHVLTAVDKTNALVSSMQLQNTMKFDDLNKRFEQLHERLLEVESKPSIPVLPSGSLPAASSGGPTGAGKGSNGKGKGKPDATSDQAKKPNCLRLKGFTCHLPKPDMIAAAKMFCTQVGIDHEQEISNFFSGAIAGSCVLEFVCESAARKAFDLSRLPSADKGWIDPETSVSKDLFLSFDESAELRAWGSALHVVYDAVWKKGYSVCLFGHFSQY